MESSAGAEFRPVRRVAVIGCGVMGRQIAWACAGAGLAVTAYDVDAAQRDGLRRQLESWQAGPGRVSLCDELGPAVHEADVAIENVPEVLDLKREVLAAAERALRPGALLLSNASSLPPSPLARALRRPDAFLNANFCHPREGERLVELMPGAATDPRAIDAARRWVRSLGLVPIVVRREIMGYVQNRIWRAVKREALHLVGGGYATVEDVDRGYMLANGCAAGPFGLMDKVGLHSVLRVEQRYFEASGDERDRPPRFLVELVERGHLGECTGRGFYSYPDPEYLAPGFLDGENAPGAPEDDADA